MIPHVPAKRSVNNRGDGTLLDRREFQYDEASDSFRCPAGQSLSRHRAEAGIVYAAGRNLRSCALKSRCP